MNIMKEKARIIGVQLSAEKKKDKPNLKNIEKLEKELELCLEELE